MNKECKAKCPSDCELGTWFVKNEEETEWVASPTTIIACGKYHSKNRLSPIGFLIKLYSSHFYVSNSLSKLFYIIQMKTGVMHHRNKTGMTEHQNHLRTVQVFIFWN